MDTFLAAAPALIILSNTVINFSEENLSNDDHLFMDFKSISVSAPLSHVNAYSLYNIVVEYSQLCHLHLTIVYDRLTKCSIYSVELFLWSMAFHLRFLCRMFPEKLVQSDRNLMMTRYKNLNS